VPTLIGRVTSDNQDRAASLTGMNRHGHSLYATYSLVAATFLGTMGLPHILVRFYTNPDGRAARQTAPAVLGLLSGFYLLPTVYAALDRLYTPELLLTGNSDAAVLLLPAISSQGWAASAGLTVSVAGVLAQNVLRSHRVHRFRLGTVIAITVPYLIAVTAIRLPIANAVGLAFAVVSSSFCPLLLLGIWWRGLTDANAVAGLVAGGGLATVAVIVAMLLPPGAAGPASCWPSHPR
jgi:Na+(H+)/acetate symporter ActP